MALCHETRSADPWSAGRGGTDENVNTFHSCIVAIFMLTDVQHKATESVIVFIVPNLSKYVSTLHVALAKLLGEKRTPLSLIASEGG